MLIATLVKRQHNNFLTQEFGSYVSLGLTHNVNLLVDYDEAWPDLFLEEKSRVADALGELAKCIEHYGSTAIRGMRAKPIIDIIVGVSPLSNWQACRPLLEKIGYDFAEHAGVPNHFIFGRGQHSGERTHLLHVVEFGGYSWRMALALRAVFNNDADLRAQYLAVKEQAILSAPLGRDVYTDLKGPFLERIKATLR
jgi:GrpB-like predicted nucleotidyltransferase (UPF0157 family)